MRKGKAKIIIGTGINFILRESYFLFRKSNWKSLAFINILICGYFSVNCGWIYLFNMLHCRKDIGYFAGLWISLVVIIPYMINRIFVNEYYNNYRPEIVLITRIRGKDKFKSLPLISLFFFSNIIALMSAGFFVNFLFRDTFLFILPVRFRFILLSFLYGLMIIVGINYYLLRKLNYLEI